MVLKVIKKVYSASIRYYTKAHYTALPSDLFEGKVIPRSKILKKDKPFEPTKYGGRHIVSLITGSPPGPKLMGYVKDVFKTAHVPVDFEEIPYQNFEDEEQMIQFEKQVLTSIHRNGVGLKGHIASSSNSFTNVSLREELDLYVCVVHVKSYHNVKCKYPNMDLLICRQNTEGEYAMLEYSAKPGLVESLKIITAENTTRFAEWCFEFALKEGRKKITIVHKANIMYVPLRPKNAWIKKFALISWSNIGTIICQVADLLYKKTKMPALIVEQKTIIHTRVRDWVHVRDIAAELRVSKNTVISCKKKIEEHWEIKRKTGSGRKKILTEDEYTELVNFLGEHRLQRKLSDGLFLKVVKNVAQSYPQLEVNDMIVDNCTMQMVQNPNQFDMIITANLYGNILSNIACGLVGGPGLMSGRNYGGSCALFEAGSRHLTFMDADNLNPTAMLNASIDLLNYIGKHQHASLIHSAIMKTLCEDKIHTQDIGGTYTSEEMVESVKANIKGLLAESDLKIF